MEFHLQVPSNPIHEGVFVFLHGPYTQRKVYSYFHFHLQLRWPHHDWQCCYFFLLSVALCHYLFAALSLEASEGFSYEARKISHEVVAYPSKGIYAYKRNTH